MHYLDHNSTSPLRPESLSAVTHALTVGGNAASVHARGRAARAIVEDARAKVAGLARAKADQVIFTSGATEANNLALFGAVEGSLAEDQTRITRVFVLAIEHSSVLATADRLAERFAWVRVSRLAVTADGVIDLEGLRVALREGKGRALVAVMAANNETGVIQPMAEVSRLVREANGLLLVDAVPAAGKIDLDFALCDYMTLSGHKLGGPIGCGALVVREDAPLQPQLVGGAHQKGRRAGTENLSGIAGFGAAAHAVADGEGERARIAHLRDHFERGLKQAVPETVVFGMKAPRLCSTSSFAIPGLAAETALIGLDLDGVMVSSGSTCSSGKVSVSHVLAAMGVEEKLAACALRASFGWSSTMEDVNAALRSLIKLHERTGGEGSGMSIAEETREQVAQIGEKYKYGFVTDIEMERAPKGLSEDTVRYISAKKGEPEWMLEWRLGAFKRWLTMREPKWARVHYPQIDYQNAYYYAAPKNTPKKQSLDEVDPKLLETYKKLGIPLHEQMALAGVAVDAVFDSVSVATTFKEKLNEAGVIFCPISEAIRDYPELVQKYLGSVVPVTDNFFATLNAAVFSDGTFVYVPKEVRRPMELSTYFRINASETGQFERTLIIADEGSYVSYLEGCTAPKRDENQLHAAVVELVALDHAEIKYSTVQNWYPGDENGLGGIFNFVTKRGDCRGKKSKISWTQVETGSAITWKYPSCILRGDDSVGEFYSIAIANHYQQADTGTKMIHLGANTKSRIISKGISAGKAQNTYRGLVSVYGKAKNARNYTQCDSLLIGPECGAHTVPYIESRNKTARIEHEATTSKIAEDQLFYCLARGIPQDEAVSLIVNGFCKEVLQQLPMEFAVEAQKLVGISLEGSVG